jgi:hypothetical protein
MRAKQAVAAAAAFALPNGPASACQSGRTPARHGSGPARNFAQAPGLPDGKPSADGWRHHAGAFTIVRSEQESLCLRASQRHRLRVPGPGGQMTLLDDGVV